MIGMSLALWGMLLSGPAGAPEPIVIANTTAGVTALSTKELKQILSLQKTRWPDGTPIALVLPAAGSAASTWMANQVLHMDEAIYRRYLLEKAYQSGKGAPTVLPQGEALTQWVAQTPGAIGITVAALPPANVSVITLNP